MSDIVNSTLSSSFRDPSGFLFEANGKIYRQINLSYQANYEALMNSGAYKSLSGEGLLIQHTEVDPEDPSTLSPAHYKTILPTQLPYVSYPYEWSFSQLKDAALLTLRVQAVALQHGMILKDASAYNVQFMDGNPVFIDSLSFETCEDNQPWVAYRQFCQHFLAPLALITHTDYRLAQLLKIYIDGIPLDLTSKLLPARSWFNYSILAHIHLHASAQRRHQDDGKSKDSPARATTNFSKAQLQGLISSLQAAVQRLQPKYAATEWGDYYADTNYIDSADQHKQDLVGMFLDRVKPEQIRTVADYGANTGKFSRLAADTGAHVLSFDIDEVAVDKNYRATRQSQEKKILPLLLDLTNPSPALGWASEERMSFLERGPADVGMALALIHHIAISNNVPLGRCAKLFSQLCHHLIIEFVPKEDSQVARLLATREDIFVDYHKQGFEEAFAVYFETIDSIAVRDSDRTLYLLRKRAAG